MFQKSVRIVMTGFLLAVVTSCSTSSIDETTDVIKLSSDEVASLLGIKEQDGLTIGEVVSGKDGVKVKSISLKSGNTEVEVHDVELRTMSTKKLEYSISYLAIGRLDILDWKSSQRAQAFGVRVDKPGIGFLAKLEKTINSARAGENLKTADLSFERLAFDKIEYTTRSAAGEMVKVKIDNLSFSEATADILGEMSIANIDIAEVIASKGLKIRQVDRVWADQMLALLVKAAMGDLKLSSPDDAHAAASSPDLSKRILPFDHIEVAELNIDVGKLLGSNPGTVKIANFHFEVQHRPTGQFAGLNGGVDVRVPTTIFPKELSKFFHDMGNPNLYEALTGSLELKMTIDPIDNSEHSTVSIRIPNLVNVSAITTTRHVPEFLGLLTTQKEISENYVLMLMLELEGNDDGLLAYLLSSRYKDRISVRNTFEEIPFDKCRLADSERLVKEIKSFLKEPKSITYTLRSENFVSVEDFMEAINKREPPASIATHFSFRSGSSGMQTPPLYDAAALKLDCDVYGSLDGMAEQDDFVSGHGFESIDGWLQAAKSGNAIAHVLIGNCYHLGRGTRIDLTEAIRWYRKAAEAGNTIAMRRIGLLYSYDSGVVEKDEIEAIRWYRKAANAGNTDAMNCLASISSDDSEKLRWYKKSAEMGNSRGMYELGALYREGKGIAQDSVEALRWFRKAADRGNEYAMLAIAECYEAGKGVSQSLVEATQWFRKAAEAGSYSAKYWLEKNVK